MAEKITQLIKLREMVYRAEIMHAVLHDEATLRFLRDLDNIYQTQLAKLKREYAEARMRQIQLLPRYEVTDIEKVFALP